MISPSDKAIVVRYLLKVAREIDERAIDGSKSYPIVGIGGGRNVTTEFMLRCERGTGVGVNPNLWVENVVDRCAGNWDELFAKAVEYWSKRGGIPPVDDPLLEF